MKNFLARVTIAQLVLEIAYALLLVYAFIEFFVPLRLVSLDLVFALGVVMLFGLVLLQAVMLRKVKRGFRPAGVAHSTYLGFDAQFFAFVNVSIVSVFVYIGGDPWVGMAAFALMGLAIVSGIFVVRAREQVVHAAAMDPGHELVA